jgi:hypothetical protein
MCPTAKHVLGGKRTSFRNTLGGSTFAIEGSHVLLKREGRVLATLLSDTPEEAIVHLPEVKADALGRVIDYCRVCAIRIIPRAFALCAATVSGPKQSRMLVSVADAVKRSSGRVLGYENSICPSLGSVRSLYSNM